MVACHYCQLELDFGMYGHLDGWTKDHVIAKSEGGRNSLDNLVACCNPCNNLKSNLTVEQFRAKIRLTIEENRAFNRRYHEFAYPDMLN